MVSGFRTKYQRTKCQKTGNRIEACQWIVARPQHLSCLTPQNGVKHDKIIFHEFFCVCNVFSFSPVSLFLPVSVSLSLSQLYLSLSISPSLSPLYLSFSPCLSTYLSLSPAPVSLSFSLPSLSLSLSFSTSTPVVSLSFSHSCFPFYSFIFLSPLSLSLFLPPYLSSYLSRTPVSLAIL